MPGVVIEAMALEVPIVASGFPQVREVTGGDAALLAAVDDTQSFADAILRCIDDRDEAQRRVALAHARFLERFTVANTARQMVTFYGQARSEPPRRWHRTATRTEFTGADGH